MLDEGKRAEFKKDFININTTNNIATDGSTMIDAEYLQVVATKK